MACEERGRVPVRGRGLCDQILRPCGHAVCADCRDELVVETTDPGLSAEVLGGAIFIFPLCAEPVVRTVPFAAPMTVPEEKGRRPEVGFVMHGIRVGSRRYSWIARKRGGVVIGDRVVLFGGMQKMWAKLVMYSAW